ncbi:hypothetical protein PsorP6_013194 [Peronosclerospora sorghi]|uniref:Uncharacterized protein n=1 Tax=Peronosclerospora sorghi TaxID=230839 RepID=A0ACC0WHY4_9STRA|nr:hypothetical protein PsorP6_013194 [Peronosclerospora sorghi]
MMLELQATKHTAANAREEHSLRRCENLKTLYWTQAKKKNSTANTDVSQLELPQGCRYAPSRKTFEHTLQLLVGIFSAACSRRDDIESLLYVLIYLMRGDLS